MAATKRDRAAREPQRRALPKGGEQVLDEIGRARIRREQWRFHEVKRDAVAKLQRDIERAIRRSTRGKWDMEANKKALPEIRAAIRRFERSVNAHAYRTAVIGAERGIGDYRKAFSELGKRAIGRPVKQPPIDVARAVRSVKSQLAERTHHVAAWSGREVGRITQSRMLLEARAKGEKISARELAKELSTEVRRRAEFFTQRVIVTEMTHAASLGVRAAIGQMQPFFPMRKQWDASLDRKTCGMCAGLDRTVVDASETFPGGIDQPPAHPFCRCSITPFVDSWARAAEAVDAMPSGDGLAQAIGIE